MKTAREHVDELIYAAAHLSEEGAAKAMFELVEQRDAELEKELKAPGPCCKPYHTVAMLYPRRVGQGAGPSDYCLMCEREIELQAEIAELRAGAAAVMEKVLDFLDEQTPEDADMHHWAAKAYQAVSAKFNTADSAAALAKVKLTEAEWWDKEDRTAFRIQRLAQLRAEAGENKA